MTFELKDVGLFIDGQFLKSASISVPVSSIKGIEIRDGPYYLQRAWIVIGSVCMMILSAWTVIIPLLCFLPIIHAFAFPPKDVILKTTNGDVKAYTVFNIFPEKKAASIKHSLDEMLNFSL